MGNPGTGLQTIEGLLLKDFRNEANSITGRKFAKELVKNHEKRFPLRDFLLLLRTKREIGSNFRGASFTKSERVFSTGYNGVTPKRGRLDPNMVE